MMFLFKDIIINYSQDSRKLAKTFDNEDNWNKIIIIQICKLKQENTYRVMPMKDYDHSFDE